MRMEISADLNEQSLNKTIKSSNLSFKMNQMQFFFRFELRLSDYITISFDHQIFFSHILKKHLKISSIFKSYVLGPIHIKNTIKAFLDAMVLKSTLIMLQMKSHNEVCLCLYG